ncbi:hypothetical protein GJAV_G00240200 [Gymnothorax javanicus]|nr:hypothetical protein GJAV_G00240200 [Gymnothorax javanicus]
MVLTFVSVAAERTDKQKQLGATKSKLQLRIQKREKDLQDVRQAVQSLKRSAQAAVEDNERILTELLRSIKRRFSKVQELIRDQEKAEVSRAEGLLERLEQEVTELRRRDADLEQLSHTEDHINFLKSCQSLSAPPGDEDSPNINVNPRISFEAVRKSISELKERLENVYKGDLTKISQRVVDIHILEPGTRDPTTREEFLRYYCRLTLDSSTVNNGLCLSNDKREVKHVGTIQSYPNHPQRFQNLAQVLCGEGLAGRCYWEVEWSGDSGVSIAVSYKKIPRKGQGNDCGLGWNSQSWSLDCSPTSFSFCHDNECTEISVPISSRIGVYLDHRAGTLSFYSVSDGVILLHRVDTIFTQPLYPGFRIYDESSVKLCSL